ncbi:glycosyltransferase family 2 protein [Amphritea sp.]|uniref:glycosyltransferase family 2 protein n=1 Tax=Amphritea sp. TaxID=1872502 RepID=UPI003A8D0002
MYKVIAIIITFNPDVKEVVGLIKSTEPQVDRIFVVDNGSDDSTINAIRNVLSGDSLVLENNTNVGVSVALNKGILEAKKVNASHVVFFDHDSLPSKNMISILLSTIEIKNKEGVKVGAVGPKYIDVKGTSLSPFVVLDGVCLKRVECTIDEIVNVDFLITSGSLISMDVFRVVGMMDESLFIDYVDTEWCLRALNKGYSFYGVGSAVMHHDLGDEFVNVFGRTVCVRSPIRNYYIIRNGVWLLFQSWVPFRWKFMDFFRILGIYFVHSLLVGERFNNFKMMTKGLFHGFLRKMGKYEG